MGNYVYMMTNKYNTVLYIGITSDLKTRVHQHRTKLFENSFTSKYNCQKLVGFRSFPGIEAAIAFEKKLKGTNRKRKEQYIIEMNPDWSDLWFEI